MEKKKPTKMERMKYGTLLHVCMYLCVLAVTVPFAVCWLKIYAGETVLAHYGTRRLALIPAFIVVYLFTANSYEAFAISSYRLREIVFRQFMAILIADGVLFLSLIVLMGRFPNLIPALITLVAQVAASALWCLLTQKVILRRHTNQIIRSILVYHSEDRAESMIRQIEHQNKFRVEKKIPYEEVLKNLSCLDSYSSVFLRGIYPEERDIIMRYCMMHGISCMIVPRVGDALINGAKQFYLFHLPVLRVSQYRPSPEYAFLKRVFDLALSSIMLVVLSPLFLVLGILIYAEDRGPVFYRQIRLTQEEKQFRIYKFRSMRTDAEKDGKARLSSGEDDPRITRIGRFLRRFRLDELPQLINIFQGDMSFVGPRPERPEIATKYEKTFPEFRLRCQAKAGLTGIAQVYGKYNTDPYDKLTMDLMYIAHPGILLDLKLILATAITFFDSESTEGIEEKK